jgi:hypothetical protein
MMTTPWSSPIAVSSHIAASVEEVKGVRAAIGVHDRCAFLFIGIAVKGEQLVAIGDPRRGVVNRSTWDVDGEVIPGIGSRRRPLESDRRRPQRHFDGPLDAVPHWQPERPGPKAELPGRIVADERDFVNLHLFSWQELDAAFNGRRYPPSHLLHMIEARSRGYERAAPCLARW